MAAWQAVTDVNDGQSYGGAAWQTAIDAISQIQTALAPDVPAWTNYTPTLGGTGWSLGSTGAVAIGQYLRLVDLIHFRARLIFGTVGASFGASPNVPTVSLPFNAAENAAGFPIRTTVDCEYRDSSGSVQCKGLGELNTSVVNLMLLNSNPILTFLHMGYVLQTVPFTWAAGDEIHVSGWYRKA